MIQLNIGACLIMHARRQLVYFAHIRTRTYVRHVWRQDLDIPLYLLQWAVVVVMYVNWIKDSINNTGICLPAFKSINVQQQQCNSHGLRCIFAVVQSAYRHYIAIIFSLAGTFFSHKKMCCWCCCCRYCSTLDSGQGEFKSRYI